MTAALGKGKAKELGLVTFFQCIVTYAFVRFNPAHLPQLEAAAAADGGAAGGAEAAAEGEEPAAPPPPADLVPVPSALRTLIQEYCLPHGKRDEALALRKTMMFDAELQTLLTDEKPALEALFHNSGGVIGGVGVSFGRLMTFLSERGMVTELKVRNTAVGVLSDAEMSKKKFFRLKLTKDMIHMCYLDSQGLGSALKGEGNPTLGYDEWVEAVLRCSDELWKEVAILSRAQRARATLEALQKKSTAEATLTALLEAAAPPRYEPTADADRLEFESELAFTQWAKVWRGVELRDLGGLPQFWSAP